MFRMRNICPNGRDVNVLMLMNEGKYLDFAYYNRYSELCIIHIWFTPASVTVIVKPDIKR
jgi:hypothetical protein